MKKRTQRSLTILFILIFAVSAGVLLWRGLERARGVQSCEEAVQVAGIDRTAPPPQQTVVSVPDDEPETIPDPYAVMLLQTDLSALREINGDVVAWVDIPDTELSYPVLQAEDNQYYLKHTWQKEKNGGGSIFMECTCTPDFSDFRTILYGHRMRNDSMFGTLKYYAEQDFWAEHPRVYVVTDDSVYVYDIFSAFEAGIREIVYRLDIEESGLEEEFIRFCLDGSVIDSGIVPESTDKILTLSTCTGNGHATRWVIHGVLTQVYSAEASG